MDGNTLSLVLSAGAFLFATGALVLNWHSKRAIRKFFAETGHEEFGEVLLAHQRQLRRNQEQIKALKSDYEKLEKESHFLLKSVGLVRYNPFANTGGNMSFSLALLNDNGDGAIVTSLHSREGVRLYSKTVKNYNSEQALTDEEKDAVERARRANS